MGRGKYLREGVGSVGVEKREGGRRKRDPNINIATRRCRMRLMLSTRCLSIFKLASLPFFLCIKKLRIKNFKFTLKLENFHFQKLGTYLLSLGGFGSEPDIEIVVCWTATLFRRSRHFHAVISV